MALNDILGGLGNMLGGNGKGGGLQDILGNIGNIGDINPQEIIQKFQNGEIDLEQAQQTLKQVASALGLDDKLDEYLKMLKK